MSVLGLELGPTTLRAVRIDGNQPRTFETDWDPDVPAPALAAVAEALGRARAVTAAIDSSLLRVRHLQLPPLPAAERRRALALESDRYFAATEPLAFSLVGDQGLTFAVAKQRLETWMEALGELGPLTRVEAATVSVARALADAGSPAFDLLRPVEDGLEWCRVEEGRVMEARRVFGDPDTTVGELEIRAEGTVYLDPRWDGEVPHALESAITPNPREAVPPRFLGTLGAALRPAEGWDEGFVTEPFRREMERRSTRRRAGTVAALAAAVLFAVLSWGAYRDRVESRIDARIATLREAVAPVVALEEEVAGLQRSLAALQQIEESRVDVLRALGALTDRIPPDTWLRTIQVADNEWQIQGTGNDAAALIPALEVDPMFEDVRFVAATRRVQIENSTYDDFAVAFRAVPAAQ
ncbi:MAG TPA: PilN domain-containing protein [Longimicrobiales bacterium]|nr:PilN domain-containing protein [Longimicrobiales bacterium]